jgi:hypothetical protein
MTMAVAHASRDLNGGGHFLLVSDTRITYEKRTYDRYTKTRWIWRRCGGISSGSSLPVTLAIENSRATLFKESAEREASGKPPLSLWDISRIIMPDLRYFYRELEHTTENPRCHLVISGFFNDGSVGLMRVKFEPERTGSIEVFRPRPGQSVGVIIGDEKFQASMMRALRRAYEADNRDVLLSAFWDLINHQGASSIGGGLDVAVCASDQDMVRWLLLEIQGRVFFRGLPISRWPEGVEPTRIAYDPSVFAECEQEEGEEADHTEQPIGCYIKYLDAGDGYAGLIFDEEPDWALTDGRVDPSKIPTKQCVHCDNIQVALETECLRCRRGIFRKVRTNIDDLIGSVFKR